MASSTDQSQQDMYYRANISTQYVIQPLPTDRVLDCLIKTNAMLAQITFVYATVSKPPNGFTMYFLTMNQDEPPPDGYIWLDSEVTKQIPLDATKTLLVHERYQGVAPNERTVSMTKKRYQLQVSNQILQVQLVHYLEADENALCKSPARRPTLQPSSLIAQQQQQQLQHQAHMYQTQPLAGYGVTATKLRGMPMAGHASPILKSSQSPTKRKPSLPSFAGQRNTKPQIPTLALEDQLLADDQSRFSVREVSMARFKRNHEFMEDILSAGTTTTVSKQDDSLADKQIQTLEQKLLSLQNDMQSLHQQTLHKTKNAKTQLDTLTDLISQIDQELDTHVNQAESMLGAHIHTYHSLNEIDPILVF